MSVPVTFEPPQLLIKEVARETAELLATGASLYNLSQGSPTLPLFEPAVEAMQAAAGDARVLSYTSVYGREDVRETVADFVNWYYFDKDNQGGESSPDGLRVSAANVLLANGCVQSIFDVTRLFIAEEADVVATPLPAYGLYSMQAEMMGGSFVPVETVQEDGFLPTAEAIRNTFAAVAADGKRIRVFVLVSPCNPTGALMTKEKVAELGAVFEEMTTNHGPFALILDEVYVGTNSDLHASLFVTAPDSVRRNTFLVFSASKGLGAMPGARAGAVVAVDTAYMPSLLAVQTCSSANANVVGQVGLKASLEFVMANPDVLDEVAAAYRAKTDLVSNRLNEIAAKHGITPAPVPCAPRATFYVWASFSGVPGVDTDLDLQRFVRDMHARDEADGGIGHGVAVIPGSAFSMDPSLKLIRFACGPDEDVLNGAMDVFDAAIGLLVRGATD